MFLGLDRHSSAKAVYEAATDRWLSYDDLREAVRERCEELGSPARALIFLFCRNDLRSVAMYLASFEAGHAVALLDDGLIAESKTALIDLYRPELISTGLDVPHPDYERVGEALWRRRTEDDAGLHSDLALLLSTSGSTGSPRFVRLTRGNVEANAESISEVLEIGPADCAITSLPIHYSYGLSVLNTHLLHGGSIALTDQGLLEPGFWETFRKAECTSFAGVPYLYQILRRLDPARLRIPTLNTMTQAGGRMDPAMIAKFSSWIAERGGRFFVMYGQTEATARISILPSSALPEKLGSVGPPIPGGRAAIDPETGELLYSGPNVMMGYAASREDLALGDQLSGTLRTGDLARLDEDGHIFITGRAKRDAKVFGLRINLDEVENLLRAHGPVAVIGKGEALRIYCEHGDEEVFAGHRRELSERLRIHHSAFVFRRLESLPLTPNGKIDYQKLTGLP
ncbi:MAG TPA: AMP-binding protein [Bryobacteraceae bacterium]|nr:AMP-binding protein [Bryobacteraceae bacterium]